MNDIKGFTFLRSFVVAMEELNKKQQMELSYAIVRYVYFDEIPNFKGNMKLAWILIEPILTKSKNKSHTNQN